MFELYNQGINKSEIARRLGCTRSKVDYAISTGPKPKRKKVKTNCVICGKEFIKKTNNQKICGNPECKKERYHQYGYGSRESKTTDGKIRPYTATSNMMILDDIAKNRSITWMAEIYDRDADDLINHIEKILSDGTADKIKRKIAAYQRSGVGW